MEAMAICAIPVDLAYEKAVAAVVNCSGKVFTTGIGKAGYIARKAASTFSTTGASSVFIHPGDASHGDIGVLSASDIIVAFSNSGKTREVLETVSFAKRLDISCVISITSDSNSPLAKNSDIFLNTGHVEEACPFGLTPTASTAVMAAIADSIAIVSMEVRGFTRKDFALRHHGGYIGSITETERHN